MIEERKQKEAGFHDKIQKVDSGEEIQESRDLTSNRKFYSVTRRSQEFKKDFLVRNCARKKVLDYCCGQGPGTFFLAQQGAEVYGIDISPASIEYCKKEATARGLEEKTHFLVMDAEDLKFPDNYFDLIVCSGVLHHLDIKKAYPQLARVLKPNGKIICTEPLVYNPIFQLYRRVTPHLRTEWEVEHILSRKDLNLAKNYFGKVELHFFHLATLCAVPFRNFPSIFNPLLSILEHIDSILLRLPPVKWLSWQVVFILSEPKKKADILQ